MSIDRLITQIRAKQNPTVLGLDPQPDHIHPEILQKHRAAKGDALGALADAFLETNRALIDACADVVPAVKLQSACYEQLGAAGITVFEQTIAAARDAGLYVIADAKRGDIGSTSAAYSAAFLGRIQVGDTKLPCYDVDCLTVNPYLGADNLDPFLADCKAYDKAIFVLCKTSNPSAADVQDLMTDGEPVYCKIADQLAAAGRDLIGAMGYSALGIVAGATQPAAIAALRARVPSLFFLVPGYGAQGGKAADLAAAFDTHGDGAIVNNSRGISCAYKKSDGDLKTAARDAARAMRDDLRGIFKASR